MKFFILNLTFLVPIFLGCYVAYADEVALANIYADELIKEFDRQIIDKEMPASLFQINTYLKIQAARIYLEENSDGGHVKSHLRYNPGSIYKLRKTQEYGKIVDVIDGMANQINNHILSLKNERIKSSPAWNYNITGRRFPKKTWALTFDDGPKSYYTKTVVDNLLKHDMQASFFMLTRQALKLPSEVQYVDDHHMEIAFHSYNHKDLNRKKEKTWQYEISEGLKKLSDLTDQNIKLFRLPYGSGLRNQDLRKYIADENLVHIFWNVDTLDWKDKDPDSIVKRTIAQMNKSPRNAGIILFHDIHPQTLVASEKIMSYLNEQELKVCTVGEILKRMFKKETSCL